MPLLLALWLLLLVMPTTWACSDDRPILVPLAPETTLTAHQDAWRFICQGAPYQPNAYVTAELATVINEACAKREGP